MSISDDLSLISQQEATLHLPAFNEEVAWRLGSRLRDLASARRLGIVIDVRRFGQPLFYCALAGSSPDNAEWAKRKANTVARFHRSSYGLGLELQHKNTTLLEKFGLPLTKYAAHGGSFPVTVTGTGVIGSLTVSGLPQRDDHQLVVEALCLATGQNFEPWRLP
jgi:uncharacterized protein (UPF0303 family)